MGMSYSDLENYGRLRKVHFFIQVNGFGPVSMFKSLLSTWGKKHDV